VEFALEERYEQPERIGEGAYGVICSATDAQGGRAEVAIKRVRPTEDAMLLRCCLRELTILRHFRAHAHPNLLALQRVVPPPEGHLSSWRHLYLVTELMDTDLHQLIKSEQELSDEHCKFFVWQLLRGLHALHSAGIVHRDIKPSNLLVNANCDLKIGDFGISRSFRSPLTPTAVALEAARSRGPEAADAPPAEPEPTEAYADMSSDGQLLTSYAVTRWYRPPELLCGNRRYGPSIDLWSTGCVLGELLGRKPVFAEKDHMCMLRAITKQLGSPSEADLSSIEDARAARFLRQLPAAAPRAWSGRYPSASSESIDLLGMLLAFDPAKRLTAASALRHEWLHDHACDDNWATLPRCPFDFEGQTLNVDLLLLAGLDAIHDVEPDYPLRLPEMLRFGIMHDRTMYPASEPEEEEGGEDLFGSQEWPSS